MGVGTGLEGGKKDTWSAKVLFNHHRRLKIMKDQ